MKNLILLILLSASASASYGAAVANVQKLSSFGTTNALTTNDLIAVSPQPGTANEGLKGMAFGDMMTAIHQQEGWINVKVLGAKGDGTTDDTAAFQAAINYGGNIIIPYTTNGYLLGALNLNAKTNVFLNGFGGIPWLKFNNNSNGFFINATNSQRTRFENLELDGGSNQTFFLLSSAGTRGGMTLNAFGNTRARNLYIHGFSRYGLEINSSNTSINPLIVCSNANSKLSDIDIAFCHMGLVYGDNSAAEYQMANNISLYNNYYGLYQQAGNCTLNNFIITYNFVGAFVAGGGNNGHGNLNNSLINHNFFNLYCYNLSVGFNFIGNQIFAGHIQMDGCYGVRIGPGELDVTSINIVGGGAGNRIEGNFCNEGSPNAITNAGGSAVCTIFNNPKKTTGTWLGTPGFYADGLGTNVLFNGGIKVTNGVDYSGSVSNVAGVGQTANRWAGRGRLTAGQQTYIVTNSIVTANTIAIATLSTNDATATSISATPTAGFLTLKANAAATGNADISWVIITP